LRTESWVGLEGLTNRINHLVNANSKKLTTGKWRFRPGEQLLSLICVLTKGAS